MTVSGSSESLSAIESNFPPARKLRVSCEYDRAYRELIGTAASPGSRNTCSEEAPESRAFPSQDDAARSYALCNGHLRDLYGALDRARPASRSP